MSDVGLVVPVGRGPDRDVLNPVKTIALALKEGLYADDLAEMSIKYVEELSESALRSSRDRTVVPQEDEDSRTSIPYCVLSAGMVFGAVARATWSTRSAPGDPPVRL